jgi:hypothetical protein
LKNRESYPPAFWYADRRTINTRRQDPTRWSRVRSSAAGCESVLRA